MARTHAAPAEYACSRDACDCLDTLSSMYFCRSDQCQQLRCQRCVRTAPDSLFCPQCLDTVPTHEAAQYQSRCSKCFLCPVCGAVAHTVASAADRFFLACQACRWTSELVALVHSSVPGLHAAALHHERDQAASCAVTNQVQRLRSDSTQSLRLAQLSESQRRLWLRRSSSNADVAVPTPAASIDEFEARRSKQLDDAAAADRAAECPGDSLTDATRDAASAAAVATLAATSSPHAVTSLSQRLRQATLVSSTADALPIAPRDLWPQRIQLRPRLARRCRQCNRFVVLPDLNPSSSSFKINNSAYLLCPRVDLATSHASLALAFSVPQQVQVVVTNPLDSLLCLRLAAVQPDDSDAAQSSRVVAALASCSVDVPPSATYVSAYNDLADLDDSFADDDDDIDALPADVSRTADGRVTARVRNAVTLAVGVTPAHTSGPVSAAFRLDAWFPDPSRTDRRSYIVILPLGQVSSTTVPAASS